MVINHAILFKDPDLVSVSVTDVCYLLLEYIVLAAINRKEKISGKPAFLGLV